MVVGESHYSSDHSVGSVVPDMTQWAVEHYLNGGLAPQAKGFFTRVGGLLAARRGPSSDTEEAPPHGNEIDDRVAIWSSIVFYNYVPVVVADGPRIRPTQAMWDAGREPFFEVMRRSQAEAVLVLGEALWNNMPASDEPAYTFDFEGQPKWARRYSLSGSGDVPNRVTATYINHPSSHGWSGTRWRPVVDFLFLAIEAERARTGR